MITSLAEKYDLPPLVDEEETDNRQPHDVAAVRIIHQLLGRRKYVREGLSREALWKHYNREEYRGSHDLRTASFTAALEQLEDDSDVEVTKTPVYHEHRQVGEIVTYRIKNRPGSHSQQRDDRRPVRRGGGKKARTAA